MTSIWLPTLAFPIWSCVWSDEGLLRSQNLYTSPMKRWIFPANVDWTLHSATSIWTHRSTIGSILSTGDLIVKRLKNSFDKKRESVHIKNFLLTRMCIFEYNREAISQQQCLKWNSCLTATYEISENTETHSSGTCFVFLNKIICALLLFFYIFSSPANVREAIMLRCEWRLVERGKMVFRFKTMLWCINVFYALSNRAQIESRCWTVAQSVVPCAYWLYWICFWRWDVPF